MKLTCLVGSALALLVAAGAAGTEVAAGATAAAAAGSAAAAIAESAAAAVAGAGAGAARQAAKAGASAPPPRTAIDDYVARADPAYSWRIASSHENDELRTVVVDLVSQRWLTEADVDRTEWRHALTLSIPKGEVPRTALLHIGGGSNGGELPTGADERTEAIAKATGSVVADLGMVPNQPLVFHGDGRPRYEDDLIGYAWDQYLQTGEARWLPRGPMVKSAVRAMDAVTEVMAEAGQTVDRFVVAGASKRGWTTWLTGAMDERVVAIVPIVIDVLNVDASMRHHFAAYGFWAPSIGNYVQHGIMRRFDHPRLAEIYALVDPYSYRHRLALPKLILNAAGDQFFLPDSSRFYWQDLRGESYLRYVPNADHGLGDSDALETLTAFHTLMLRDEKPPRFTWRRGHDGSLRVLAQDEPREVRLWQAHNAQARDFRVETLGRRFVSSVVEPSGPGLYEAQLPAPEQGWTAWFLELAFDVGAAAPLRLTTDVAIAPDVLPFADKPPSRPESSTAHCALPGGDREGEIASAIEAGIRARGFAEGGRVDVGTAGGRLYVNWTQRGELFAGAGVGEALAELGCEEVAFQFESGPGYTLPPGQ